MKIPFRQTVTPPASIPNAPRRRLRYDEAPLPIYAVGDIHGCYQELMEAEQRIAADLRGSVGGKARVVYLGDYVDRGAESKAVLDHLSRNDHADDLSRLALCGNHDDTFLNFMNDPVGHLSWLDFGGMATLYSYGIDPDSYLRKPDGPEMLAKALHEALPARHRHFLENLPIMLCVRDLVFVHAGIRPGRALERQDDDDLLWIRDPFLSQGPRLPVTVIHGHTICDTPVASNGRIGIDTGCYATGRLTVLKLAPDGTSLI
ncbi:MAG: metallophosphoesterase family protein [Shinella sp.]|nr:metallophosphoesterase family protein [Shinella sp.]